MSTAFFTFVLASMLWGDLRPGPHAVGFRTFMDASVPGSAGWEARPIEIALWYPASSKRGKRMTYGDLFALSEDLKRRSESMAVAVTGDPAGLTAEMEQKISAASMRAVRDATPGKGPFPVVMWNARYGTTAAQAVLSEYLASHGYVVAFARPKEGREKLPFEAKEREEKLEELDAQGDDLRGALRAVRLLPYADDSRTALLAWSYAGESAWRISQSDARIDLIIALDTNVNGNWVYQPSIEPVPMRVPMVDLRRDGPGLEGLAHGNFNTIEGMVPGVFGIERVQKWSKGGPMAKRGYETIARRVLEALSRTRSQPRPVPFETIQLRAADGGPVTADLYRHPNPKGCVALFHQSRSSRGEYRTIAPELVRLGFTALSVDVRWGHIDRWNDVLNETAAHHGTPEAQRKGERAKIDAIRAGAIHDLEAAVDWLRANGCAKPLVWGASIHANGVFELAHRRADAIAGIVDVSPGEYDNTNPEKMRKLVAQITTPALVLWGRTERDLSKPVFDALPAGAKWSYESTGRHGNALLFEDARSWAAVRDFLKAVGY